MKLDACVTKYPRHTRWLRTVRRQFFGLLSNLGPREACTDDTCDGDWRSPKKKCRLGFRRRDHTGLIANDTESPGKASRQRSRGRIYDRIAYCGRKLKETFPSFFEDVKCTWIVGKKIRWNTFRWLWWNFFPTILRARKISELKNMIWHGAGKVISVLCNGRQNVSCDTLTS